MSGFDPVNIEFLINSEAVKVESDKVKKSLMQIGYTAEEAEKKVSQKLHNSLTNQALKTLPILEQQGVKTQRVWNGLGNSINQLSREIPAFAVNAQTGFLAISNNLPILADEIQRLKLKNEELIASGQKGVPVWKQVLKGLISWQTALSVGVALLTIYGADIVKWIGTVFKGKEAIDELKLSQEALNAAYESSDYQKVIKNLFELNSLIKAAKNGTVEKEVALKKYNETLGKAYKKTNDLNVAEAAVKDKTPAWVKAMLYKAAAMSAASTAAKELAENQAELSNVNFNLDKYKKLKKEAETSGNTIASTDGKSTIQQDAIDGANKEIAELQKQSDEIIKKNQNVVNDLQAKAAKIAKEAGLDIFGEPDKDPKGTVSKYQSLMDKITAIDREYSRKSYTKDQEEIQALKDKFSKIRDLVERYNADPKNKAKIIDLTSFNALEGKASSELVFRQETEHLKTELTERKKLFKEFEDYKKTFGLEAAKKEYADKIGDATTYYEFLKDLERKNKTSFTAVSNGSATGGQIERVKFINENIKDATVEQRKLFNEQLAALLSYQKKREILIKNHLELLQELKAKGATEEILQAKKNHQKSLDNLDDSNAKQLKSYKALQRGIVGLTTTQAKVVIANVKKLLNDPELNISEDLRAKIEQTISKLEKSLSSKLLDDIYNYTRELGSFANSLEELGEVLGSSDLINAGSFLNGIAGGLDNFFNALDAETKQEKVASGIASAISLITIFTGAAAKRKAAEEEYYLNVIGFQNQYNLGLAEQKRLQSELAENVFLTDYVGRIQDGVSAISIANDGLEDALEKLREKGRVVTGQRNAVDWGNVGAGAAAGAALGSVVPVIGTIAGAIGGAIIGLFSSKKKDNTAAILQEYPELVERAANGMQTVNVELAEALIANKLVKGETAEILQNILDWQQAIDDARQQINEVISDLAGSLGDDLRTSLVDAFVAGEDAAVKMGDTVEAVLENVLSNFLFNQIFQEAFDELQKQMAASFDVGGDGDWVDDFSRFFTSASALTDDFNNAMEAAQAEAAALGFSIFENTENPNSLTGGIRRDLTEETGSELLGLFRGYYDLTKVNNQGLSAFLEVEKQHINVSLEILAMNTLIEANTRQMVLEIIKSNQHLASIDETSTEHFLFVQ